MSVSRLRTWLAPRAQISGLLNPLLPSYPFSKLRVPFLGTVCGDEVSHQHQGRSRGHLWHLERSLPWFYSRLSSLNSTPQCLFLPCLRLIASPLTSNCLHQQCLSAKATACTPIRFALIQCKGSL